MLVSCQGLDSVTVSFSPSFASWSTRFFLRLVTPCLHIQSSCTSLLLLLMFNKSTKTFLQFKMINCACYLFYLLKSQTDKENEREAEEVPISWFIADVADSGR